MAEIQHLNNAPIQEALYDIQVELEEQFSPSDFDPLVEQYRERFPKHLRFLTTQFALKEGMKEPPTPSPPQVAGIRIDSEDGLRIVQFRENGYTFNRLKPYPGWEKFSAEANDLWKEYHTVASPLTIRRLALRYINQFCVPKEGFDLGKYFKAFPMRPDGVDGALGRFLTQVAILLPESGAQANITQVMDPDGGGPSEVSLVLDIDVYVAGEFAVEELEPIFHTLKQEKNRLFFNYLTDEIIRGFE